MLLFVLSVTTEISIEASLSPLCVEQNLIAGDEITVKSNLKNTVFIIHTISPNMIITLSESITGSEYIQSFIGTIGDNSPVLVSYQHFSTLKIANPETSVNGNIYMTAIQLDSSCQYGLFVTNENNQIQMGIQTKQFQALKTNEERCLLFGGNYSFTNFKFSLHKDDDFCYLDDNGIFQTISEPIFIPEHTRFLRLKSSKETFDREISFTAESLLEPTKKNSTELIFRQTSDGKPPSKEPNQIYLYIVPICIGVAVIVIGVAIYCAVSKRKKIKTIHPLAADEKSSDQI